MLAYIGERPLRFNEILRFGGEDGLNARTLSRSLKILAVRGIVNREVMGTEPIAVQYTLTDRGRRFGRLLAEFQHLDSDPSVQGIDL